MKTFIFNLCIGTALSISSIYGQTAESTPIYLDDSQPIEARVQDALNRMTIEEKARLSYAQGKFSSPGCPRLGIPELWYTDGPHGVRAEINWNDWGYSGWTNDSCTAFPALTCLAATWNPELSGKYGKAIGEEARYREKDVLLGPGVNIYRTPLNGRNFEYMGEDPYLTSEMCVPYIQEVQKNGVAACVKHYALNNQELWRDHIDVEVSDRALYEIYLPAFKAAVERGGTWTIMGAYNKIRGTHATHHKLMNNDILKGEWKFDGCVVTDWGAAHDTYEAAMYGLDVEMGSYTNGLTTESAFGYDDYYLGKNYLKMIKEGKIPMEVVNEKAARVLKLIFRTAMNRNKPYGSKTTPEHYHTAYEIATEGTVLLKNGNGKKQAGILPLQPGKYKRILVVGDNATRNLMTGGGSSELKPKDFISPLEGIRKKFGNVTYAQGYTAGRDMFGQVDKIPQSVMDSLRNDAIAKAADADLIIYVGGLNKNHQQDCEGGDRLSYNLPFGQDELIQSLAKVNKNMIVVLLSGNAVAMPWLDEVPSIVQGWYFGTITFDELCYPGDSIKEIYREDILVGYRWYDTKHIKPMFPFGHGLSYTTFEYSKPVASAKKIDANGSIDLTVKVKNTGNVAGKEIIQLYIGDEKCSVLRPVKELKGFQKIALNPGEEKEVTFTITPDALKFFDEQQHGWKAEPGKFKAYIGASSTDIRGTVEFELL